MYEWPLWTVFSNAQTQWLTICSYVPAPNKIDESLWRHFCTLSIWACNSNQSFDSVSDQFLKGKWTNGKKFEFTLTIRMMFRLSGIFPSYLETVQTIGMIFRLSGIFPGYPEIFQAIQKRKSPSHRPPSVMRNGSKLQGKSDIWSKEEALQRPTLVA